MVMLFCRRRKLLIKVKKCSVMVFLLSAVLASCAKMETTAKFIDMTTRFQYFPDNKAALYFKFDNDTEMQLCIYVEGFIGGPSPEENITITDIGSGKLVPYIGPVPDLPTERQHFIIVPSGRSFSGVAIIGNNHNLEAGTYRVQHYAQAVTCPALDGNNYTVPHHVLVRLNDTQKLDPKLLGSPSVILRLDTNFSLPKFALKTRH
jgi:hypothetical protein